MTKDEVKSLVQVNPVIVYSILDGQESWRYDIGAKEGYSHEVDVEGLEQSDVVDVEGLKQKKLEGVLFVEWTKDSKVNSFTIYYPANDGTIQEYRVFETGQIKETTPFKD
ncbi:hypothetical protein J2T17_007172 [Paenibacillus mucilaginosus]|uniref:hypothetical protein n=1 Tax=Paenibacillus mucilaginosus TaxID=61624 RepID=UPI003D20B252